MLRSRPVAVLRRVARPGFVVLALALLLLAVVHEWRPVRDSIGDLGPLPLLLSVAAALAGLFASAMSWRALLADLGTELPVRATTRIFFVGQLGKYLPGSVWPVLAQMELGRTHGASRRRVGATAIVVMAMNVTVGLLVAALVLPFTSPTALGKYGWALLALPIGLVVMYPPVLSRLIDRTLLLARREPLEHPLSAHGVLSCAAWTLVMWVFYGLHILALAVPLHAHGARLPLLCVGAYAVAWTAGFLFVIAPAGVGVREAALVLALGPALAAGPATVVALVSRLLMTVGDLIWGAAGGLLRPRQGAEPTPAADMPKMSR